MNRAMKAQLLSFFILPPSSLKIVERETRLELATLALARRCSTTELLPLLSTTDSNDSMIVVKRSSFQDACSICNAQLFPTHSVDMSLARRFSAGMVVNDSDSRCVSDD